MFTEKVLGVIISFEVASQRPPIFLLVDYVLVDCYLCFAHCWIDMAPSYKEMLLEQQKSALGLLLSRLKDGVLLWGSLTIVADEIGVAHSTISKLWGQVHRACEESLIITPEIASQNHSSTERYGSQLQGDVLAAEEKGIGFIVGSVGRWSVAVGFTHHCC